MLRAIKEIQPRWVVGENVYGLINWNGGLVFDEVQADLEAAGYEVFPYVLPAAGVNAPHQRYRVWFVAYSRHYTTGKAGNSKTNERCKSSALHTKGQRGYRKTILNSRLCNLSGSTPNANLYDRCRSKSKKHSTKRGFYAQRRIRKCISDGNVANTNSRGLEGAIKKRRNSKYVKWQGEFRNVTDTDSKRSQRQFQRPREIGRTIREEGKSISRIDCRKNTWDNFPTQRPIRGRNDGVSNKLLIFVVKELYEKISNTSQENRTENLSEVWKRISQEEVWEKIRGLYSLESKEILFQTMQLYSEGYKPQDNLSPFSKELSKPVMQHLSKYGEFRRSPQGQKLEKQRTEQFGNTLSFLPHEVALAARRFETAVAKFDAWHRNESIKAYGNAIVPQVAHQIFKAIEEYEQKT